MSSNKQLSHRNPIEQLRILGLTWKTAHSNTIMKTPEEGIFFGRMVFHPSSNGPETCLCQSALKLTQHINKTLHDGISLYICHPRVYVKTQISKRDTL